MRASNVRRGIGTIRQDVNLSVKVNGKWGKRIEIKGVQDPSLIEKTILTETKRQKKLIKEGKSKEEVRKAELNGNTIFLRPLPGKDRMYPETDLPILSISRDMINKAKKSLPKLKSEIRGELKSSGLSEEMTKLILSYNKLEEFKELLTVYENPNLIAKLLILWPKEISIKENKPLEEIEKLLSLDILETILFEVKTKKINENHARDSMRRIIQGEEVKDAIKFEEIENLEEEILKIVKSKPGLRKKVYMGLAMKKFKGKIPGKELMDIINNLVKE